MIDFILENNGLQHDDKAQFKSELKTASLKKGEIFLHLGQVSRQLAFIEMGYLRTYHLDGNANEITTEFNQPGDFCSSYYSFYQHSASFECIEAITDCDLLLLSYDSLQKLYSQNLSFNAFGRKVLEKACIERDFRLKKVLYLSAKEKYEWFLENYPEVYKVAKLGQVAAFLSMKQETLSRVRRKYIS